MKLIELVGQDISNFSDSYLHEAISQIKDNQYIDEYYAINESLGFNSLERAKLIDWMFKCF